MSDSDSNPEFDVDAARPDTAIVGGTDHVTVTGSNPADTVEFYRDLLGMPLVMEQPNLDQPDVTHLFFDTGDGRVLTFFVTDDRPSNSRPPQGVGSVHHLAFRVDADRLAEVKERLTEAGKRVSEFDRGAFHSLYTRDNNGLTIELVADKFPVPDERRGEVLALAHQKRVAAGDDYVDDEHVRAAIDDLGLDVQQRSVPDAPAGRGFED